jgi:V/A-type H+-transporting ATPase subunit A
MLLDMAFLQQDAFDEVDACMPRERQVESLRLIKRLVDRDYNFANRDEARDFFTNVIGLSKNWNYSPQGSAEYEKYTTDIEHAAAITPSEVRSEGGEGLSGIIESVDDKKE